MAWDYTTIPQNQWINWRLDKYHQVFLDLALWYANVKAMRELIEVWLGETTSIKMHDFIYSDNARKNIALHIDRGQNQNVYTGFSYNTNEILHDVDYDEGFAQIQQTVTVYTNNQGGSDYYWRNNRIAVLNKVNIEAFVRAIGDKGEPGSFVKNLEEYDGKIGGEWPCMFGFKSVGSETIDEYTTEWQRLLLPQWHSNLGGPQ